MMQNMPREQMEHICHKMYHKRNLLLRAFAINLALIIFVWILSMSGWFDAMMGRLMHCGADNAETYVMHILGAWKVANVAFFLAPALAAWWEMKCCRACGNDR
ncbi:MAG: hypothetical protein LBL21_00960 [Rickettsiales bacterium]|jgi:hypothetical protein|nr:hypothetical protein [Rickettsiales bacterium]